MAGLGERFYKEGYLAPKPLVKVKGKPIISYLLDCLFPLENETVYIPYITPLNIQSILISKFANIEVYDDLGFLIDSDIGKGKGMCKCIELTIPTKGATDTLLVSTRLMDLSKPLVSFDCDNFYLGDVLERMRSFGNENGICYFEDEQQNPIYSYIRVEKGIVVEIKEKEKISNMACSGIYYFGNTGDIQEKAKTLVQHSDGKEIYLSELYKKLQNVHVKCEQPISLGIPMAVELFSKSSSDTNQQIYCFDLDDTLVTISNSYENVKPICENIIFLQKLKKMGHRIIIHTARGMKSMGGNLERIISEVKPTVVRTLEKFNIPYDELIFGKPYADFYIDDKAISTLSNLQKETGMYISIVNPNIAHTMTITKDYYIKEGNLEGEKWWYDNIPPMLQDLFPKIGKESTNTKLYIEKIEGLTFSEKYVLGTLTPEHLNSLFETLERLHGYKDILHTNLRDTLQNIIVQRYEKGPYPLSYDCNNLYSRLRKNLEKYSTTEICMIHGDPVFTNVIITSTNTLKLIDMRGKIGDSLSVFGDPNYDFAKIYQSLIGYDFIIHQQRPTSPITQSRLITSFEKKMGTDRMKWMYLLTSCLFFTLIPLHSNETENQLLDYCKMSERLLNKFELHVSNPDF